MNDLILGKLSAIQTAQLPASLAACMSNAACDILTLDLRHATSQSDALQLIAQRGGFPDYFGGNLDALFDIVNERANGNASIAQAWLIRSSASQQKAWFPIMDTLRDALSDTANTQLTILWWVAD
jgi:RNAse (barnase) inhibitor barstar